MTLEGSPGRQVAEEAGYRILRMARVPGWPRATVPRGYVLTLPSGGLLAVLREDR